VIVVLFVRSPTICTKRRTKSHSQLTPPITSFPQSGSVRPSHSKTDKIVCKSFADTLIPALAYAQPSWLSPSIPNLPHQNLTRRLPSQSCYYPTRPALMFTRPSFTNFSRPLRQVTQVTTATTRPLSATAATMGVQKTVISEGNGPSPQQGDKVTMEYAVSRCRRIETGEADSSQVHRLAAHSRRTRGEGQAVRQHHRPRSLLDAHRRRSRHQGYTHSLA